MRFELTLLLLVVLAATSCREIPPVVTPAQPTDTETESPVSEQKRQVLLEEFSGVRCVNCPAGSDAIRVLLDIYGPQLVPVNIHTGFFADPYPESRYDFQLPAGKALLDYLGQPLGFPTAVVNRKLFPGEEGLQLTQRDWAGYIAEELTQPPRVKMEILRNYEAVTRRLDITVNLYPQEDLSAEPLRLSVLLTENGIKDFQLTPEGKKGDYEHVHVLRELLTDTRGDQLSGPVLQSGEISREFSIVLPENWQAEQCEIVTFVHLDDGATKDVLQAHRTSVQ